MRKRKKSTMRGLFLAVMALLLFPMMSVASAVASPLTPRPTPVWTSSGHAKTILTTNITGASALNETKQTTQVMRTQAKPTTAPVARAPGVLTGRSPSQIPITGLLAFLLIALVIGGTGILTVKRRQQIPKGRTKQVRTTVSLAPLRT